jgi:SAM-dependent methyltransferase
VQEPLKTETERLARSWNQHPADWLRDYLVSSVEDPRINLQSILSRHFLVRGVFGERFEALMEQEYRFSAVMNWLIALGGRINEPEELRLVLEALRRGIDNAEGMPIPRFVLQSFASLPCVVPEPAIPNYIERFLKGAEFVEGSLKPPQASLDTFAVAWSVALREGSLQSVAGLRRSVLEPACGSANDYRFLQRYGIAEWLDYTGLDLSYKNIENARSHFPGVRFELGNAFELPAGDQVFDFCFVHDLFEHLSPEGLTAAAGEIARVTRQGICLGFFNMDEIPDHVICPVDEYHWNKLSVARTKALFTRQGWTCRVVHIGTFLRQYVGCPETHNPNAYTFFLWRNG